MTFARHRYTGLKTIIAIVVLILVWGIIPIGLKSCARETIWETQAPLWTALRDVNEFQDRAALSTASKDQLIDIIQELSRTQSGLELRLKTLDAAEAQRTRLEAILKMPAQSGYETRVARVIRRDLNGWWQQLWIDRGTTAGLKPGMGVITREGVAGRLREVYENTAVVELITSPRLRLAAQISGDDRPFIYQGQGLRLGLTPFGLAQALQPEMALKPNERKLVVTTGLSGSFPEGMPVGYLIETGKIAESGLLEGRVELFKNLEWLKEVTILVPNR